jgi:hypothetical protein
MRHQKLETKINHPPQPKSVGPRAGTIYFPQKAPLRKREKAGQKIQSTIPCRGSVPQTPAPALPAPVCRRRCTAHKRICPRRQPAAHGRWDAGKKNEFRKREVLSQVGRRANHVVQSRVPQFLQKPFDIAGGLARERSYGLVGSHQEQHARARQAVQGVEA